MVPVKERWPDFLIIGAAKAGTTALFKAIARHSQVYASTRKEPRYFSYAGSCPHFPCPGGERSADGIVYEQEEYLKLFQECAPGQKAGEASTGYLRHPAAPANASARVPSARLIAILRHPVERAYSQWLHMRHKGSEELSDFETALCAENHRREQGWRLGWLYQSGGCYGSQLQRWLRYYPSEQLLILLYEDWQARPQETLSRVFEHLGVDISEDVLITKENVSSMQPRWGELHYRYVRDSAPRRWALRHLPLWSRDAINRSVSLINLKPGPRLDPSLRDRLAPAYHSEIDILESLTGRDLHHWRGA